MDCAHAVYNLLLRKELLASDAIESFVGTLFDIAVFLAAAPHLLSRFLMMWIRGSYEVQRIGKPKSFLEFLEFFGIKIYILFYAVACLRGRIKNLLAMFVSSCIKKYLVSQSFMKANPSVGLHDLKREADMRPIVHVRQSGREIKLSHRSKCPILPLSPARARARFSSGYRRQIPG